MPVHEFQLFFGEYLNGSSNVPLSNTPNASIAESDFLSNLTGDVGTENFESFATGTSSPVSLDFGVAGTAVLSGTGEIVTREVGTAFGGRYPISGTNFWRAVAGSGMASDFTINFSQSVAGVGFFGVDLGDFGGNLTLV